MAWKSIHWNYNPEWRQKTRFERYADDSWALIIGIGHAYVAFKGQKKWRPRPNPTLPNAES